MGPADAVAAPMKPAKPNPESDGSSGRNCLDRHWLPLVQKF